VTIESADGEHVLQDEANMEFCAHARTALPAALDELDANADRIQALADQVAHFRNLAIELGAKPEQLQDEYAVKLYHMHERQARALLAVRKWFKDGTVDNYVEMRKALFPEENHA
jgi:hypothetical protein